MKKIPTLFERDWGGDRRRVVNQVHHGCEWVIAGEGSATRKYDGVCCMYDGACWYKRREIRDEDVAKKGIPKGFILVERDSLTGKSVGWVPIGEGPEDRSMCEAVEWTHNCYSETGYPPPRGTYEFLGPKSQGNVEAKGKHQMLWHVASEEFAEVPRTFDGLHDWFADKDIEGLVFHHPDGRMAKVKLRDFGLKRQVLQEKQ